MSDEVPNLRHASPAERLKTLGTVVAVVMACVTIGGIFVTIGKNAAAVERIGRIEDKQVEQGSDLIGTHYEAKAANAAVQRVELKVDEGFKDLTSQLREMQKARRR